MIEMLYNSDYVNDDGLYAFSDVKIVSDIDYHYGNFGFMNEAGEIIIPAQYLYVSQFSNGYAVICTKWKMEKDGRPFFIEFNYIDKDGKVVFEKGFAEAHDFNLYGVAAVWKGPDAGEMCLIDKEGNEIEGSSFHVIGNYNEPEDRYYSFSSKEDNGDYFWGAPVGLYDTKERRVLFEDVYSDIDVINDDMFLAEVYTDKGCFDTQEIYINSKGEPIFKQQAEKGFWSVTVPDEHGDSIVSVAEYRLLPDNASSWIPFDGKKYERIIRYGVIDQRGDFIISAEYREIVRISEGKYRCTAFENGEEVVIDVLNKRIDN